MERTSRGVRRRHGRVFVYARELLARIDTLGDDNVEADRRCGSRTSPRLLA
jgi:hypothetical protein